jgi:phage shock protein B
MNITAVAIVAIICWAIVELRNGSKNKKKNQVDTQHTEHLQQQVSSLQERIETLEKIVTDDKYQLNKQFEDLHKDNAA